jgi:hypothetical protein
MDVERFAALVARFAANTSEPEAMIGGRLMIREAEKEGVRLIDLLFRPDVLAALDAAIKPIREVAPDVGELKAENEELRGIVIELRDMREMDAEELAKLRKLAAGMGHASRLARVSKECGSMVIIVVMFALLASWMDSAFHHNEPAQTVHTAQQIDTREWRQWPPFSEEQRRQGRTGLRLVECPDGVTGRACDAYAAAERVAADARWANLMASQASATKTRQRKPKPISPEEELLERIRKPDDATLRAFVTPVVRGDVAPVVTGNLEQELGQERAPQGSQTAKPGWSHVFGPNYKGGAAAPPDH